MTVLGRLMSHETPTIALVVPSYNEEAALGDTIAQLLDCLKRLRESGRVSTRSYVVFVDDGSTDRTWRIIERAACDYPGQIHGVKLAKNAGHQNALLAGLLTQIGKADAMVSLDADLQDDVGVIAKMVDHFNNDAVDIVFGVRKTRMRDTFFKRTSANLFYRIMMHLMKDTIPHHADFRLMSARAVRLLSEFREVNVFLRGLVVKLGFTTAIVEFERVPRLRGETKYPLRKMVQLAIDGITSFSIRPLYLVALFSLILVVICLVFAALVLLAWASGDTVQGWTSVMMVVLILSAIQTSALAVIAVYVGKIYVETKARPRYIIERDISGAPEG